jgi:hypothetical protein
VNCKLDYPAMKAEVTLDTDEELSIARLDLAVHRIALDPVGVWNVELILPVTQRNLHLVALDQMGFVPAGNLTSGTVTSLRLRKSLRRSGDGHAAGHAALNSNRVNGGLSGNTTVCRIAHSQESQIAVNQLEARLANENSDDAVTARVRKLVADAATLKAMHDQPLEGPKQPPEVEAYINRTYEKESADILSQIKQLARHPESA